MNDNTNYRFVAYFFDSIAYRTQIQNLVKGVKVYSITNKILKDTFLFFPPENEQEAIAQFIDNNVSKIFSSSKILEKQIKKMWACRQKATDPLCLRPDSYRDHCVPTAPTASVSSSDPTFSSGCIENRTVSKITGH